MAIVQIPIHVSELIFESIKQMVMAHNFKFNDDISDTNVGRLDKEFKLLVAEVENTGRSNLQALRLKATYEITLFHNAEGNTEAGQEKALRDIENVIFEIERFAPTGIYSTVRSLYVDVTNLLNWTMQPINVKEDSRLQTVIQYEIGYKVPNPAA